MAKFVKVEALNGKALWLNSDTVDMVYPGTKPGTTALKINGKDWEFKGEPDELAKRLTG